MRDEYLTGSRPAASGRAVRVQDGVVASDLDALRGPLQGRVQLPGHLDSSDRAFYDLADEHRRDLLYVIVMLETGGDECFSAWLDRDTLMDSWPRLHLPRAVRAAWEDRHPVLRERGASLGAPRP